MPSTESVIVKESGFDLGFAVLIDAFVIRNVPSTAVLARSSVWARWRESAK